MRRSEKYNTNNSRARGIKNFVTPKKMIFICIAAAMTLLIVAVFMLGKSYDRITDGEYTHAEKFKDCIVVDGIDVSYAQGSDIDWKKVKHSGVDFVFIRAGYRSIDSGRLHEDETFRKNINGAEKAGLMVGVYFYSQALNKKEADEEAKYLLGLIKKHRPELPIVMDYEFFPDGRLQKHYNEKQPSQKYMNEVAKAFCDRVEDAGYESMVYANYDFLVNCLDGEALGDRTNIWLAHYANRTEYPHRYGFWQCAADSKVPGIATEVDRDFMYINADEVTPSMSRNLSGKRSIGSCDVAIRDDAVRYMGFAAEPGITVKHDGSRLKENRDYIVSYVMNTAPGTGYAVITGTGEYKDTVVRSFKIKKLL